MELGWRSGATLPAFIAFGGVAYNLFVVELVHDLVAQLYAASSPSLFQGVASASLVGAVVGMIAAGVAADVIGRRPVSILSTLLMLVGVVGSGCVFSTGSPDSLYVQLALWRAVAGVGLGAEYPLIATVVSEGVDGIHRGKALVLVFLAQGLGRVLAALVPLLLVVCISDLQLVWRLALLLGAAPAAGSLYWRWRHFRESSLFLDAVRQVGPGADAGGADAVSAPAGHELRLGTPRKLSPPAIAVSSTCLVAMPAAARDPTEDRSEPQQAWDFSGSGPLSAAETARRYGGPSVVSTSSFDGSTAAPPQSVASTVHAAPQSLFAAWPHSRREAADRIRAAFGRLAGFRRTLLVTCLCWALVDAFLYGQSLFTAQVLNIVGFDGQTAEAGGAAAAEDLLPFDGDDPAAAGSAPAPGGDAGVLSAASLMRSRALGATAIALIALPGYFVAWLSIDSMGRKQLQTLGFFMCAVSFFLLGVGDRDLQQSHSGVPFLLLFGLVFAFTNMGPNSTTWTVAAEAFPTRMRATGHGISAAAGKLGAVLGSALIPFIVRHYTAEAEDAGGSAADGRHRGVTIALFVCAAIAGGGALLTRYAGIETRSQDLKRLDAAASEKEAASAAAAAEAAAAAAAGGDDDDAHSYMQEDGTRRHRRSGTGATGSMAVGRGDDGEDSDVDADTLRRIREGHGIAAWDDEEIAVDDEAEAAAPPGREFMGDGSSVGVDGYGGELGYGSGAGFDVDADGYDESDVRSAAGPAEPAAAAYVASDWSGGGSEAATLKSGHRRLPDSADGRAAPPHSGTEWR